mmetsp:Transcript_22219/g.57959  ORF Transcript_22219/g.57959 Transcript_22219/m.57959 type:complete len:197 (-) Transcript_22219:1262-1852(-)
MMDLGKARAGITHWIRGHIAETSRPFLAENPYPVEWPESMECDQPHDTLDQHPIPPPISFPPPSPLLPFLSSCPPPNTLSSRSSSSPMGQSRGPPAAARAAQSANNGQPQHLDAAEPPTSHGGTPQPHPSHESTSSGANLTGQEAASAPPPKPRPSTSSGCRRSLQIDSLLTPRRPCLCNLQVSPHSPTTTSPPAF